MGDGGGALSIVYLWSPNVEGSRAATFAAKPLPAVAGPCWPTS